MDIDDSTLIAETKFRGQDLHVAGEYDEVDFTLMELVKNLGFMELFHLGGVVEERNVIFSGQRPEVGVVPDNKGDTARFVPSMDLLDKIKQTVGLFGDEDGDVFHLFLLINGEGRLHAHRLAGHDEIFFKLGKGFFQVRQVYHHVHGEDPLQDALIDVFDINVIFKEEGGDGGDDALVIGSHNADPPHPFAMLGHFGENLPQLGIHFLPFVKT